MGPTNAQPARAQLRTRPARRVTSRCFAPDEPAYHSRACCLGSAGLRPVFLRPARSEPQICPAFCRALPNVSSALSCSSFSCSFYLFSKVFCCSLWFIASLAPLRSSPVGSSLPCTSVLTLQARRPQGRLVATGKGDLVLAPPTGLGQSAAVATRPTNAQPSHDRRASCHALPAGFSPVSSIDASDVMDARFKKAGGQLDGLRRGSGARL